MANTRLNKQIDFLIEIDRLKTVFRRAYLADSSRRENSAEHSWHVSVMAVILAEYCREEIDLFKVLKMLLIHDIVEVDAGDAGVFEVVSQNERDFEETQAADRLFGLLPPDQKNEFRALWDEFEAKTTPEAKYAKALDRLMPLIHNYCTQGRRWKEDGIVHDQVLELYQVVKSNIPELWEFTHSLINECVEKGYLPER